MEEFIGRQVVLSQARVQELNDPHFCIRPAMSIEHHVICQRCGSQLAKAEHRLPSGKYFCSVCLKFGKLTSDDRLVSIFESPDSQLPREVLLTWQGSLTTLQQTITDRLLQSIHAGRNSLVWAVTGSGKTEMIFYPIHAVLSKGGRVCVTSPRIDVCRELYPRIKNAFELEPVLLLHGNSEESYCYRKLTICTTHQLLHFYQAFDLIIVDEIDAFPYEGDPMLRYGLKQALHPTGRLIYLTATPPQHLLREVEATFAIEKLPVRFHKRPLIVPECHWYLRWESCYKKPSHMKKFLKLLRELLQDNDVLVFCPSLSYMDALYQATSRFFAEDIITSVHAEDENRKEKVEKMRQKKYRILFTSTILERGVTFERVSVIVMGANHAVFSKSALVQIAGRVDRKGAYHHGRVLFFYNQNTQAIRQARNEIKEMNALAKKVGDK